jgi:hypothetical protein
VGPLRSLLLSPRRRGSGKSPEPFCDEIVYCQDGFGSEISATWNTAVFAHRPRLFAPKTQSLVDEGAWQIESKLGSLRS